MAAPGRRGTARSTRGDRHARLAGGRASVSWQSRQVHVAPQLQTGPHWHDAAAELAGFWQPHLHSAPLHTAHAHTFD
jgi:hypothetical protein